MDKAFIYSYDTDLIVLHTCTVCALKLILERLSKGNHPSLCCFFCTGIMFKADVESLR